MDHCKFRSVMKNGVEINEKGYYTMYIECLVIETGEL